MANRPNVFAEGRHILPTQDLYITRDKFGSNVPAYNNVYDVWIDFSGKGLTRFINQHTFYDNRSTSAMDTLSTCLCLP